MLDLITFFVSITAFAIFVGIVREVPQKLYRDFIGHFPRIHNFIGYRSKWRKRHALLHVIETHFLEHLDEWPFMNVVNNTHRRSQDYTHYNAERRMRIDRSGKVGRRGELNIGWIYLDLPVGWKDRITRAVYERDKLLRAREEAKKQEKKRLALQTEYDSDKELLDSFKPKLIAERNDSTLW
jgi:hypothetical protein